MVIIMKFMAKYSVPLLFLIMVIDSLAYAFYIINTIPFILFIGIALILILYERNAYIRKISSQFYDDLDPIAFLKQIEEIERFNSFGGMKYNFLLYKSGALCEAGRYDEAIDTLESIKASKIFFKNNSVRYACYNNLFVCYMVKKDYDRAKECIDGLNDCIATIKNGEFYKSDIVIKENLYNFYTTSDEEEKYLCLQFYNARKESIMEQRNDKYSRIVMSFRLGQMYYELNMFEEALDEFDYVSSYGNKLGVVNLSENYIEKINLQLKTD